MRQIHTTNKNAVHFSWESVLCFAYLCVWDCVCVFAKCWNFMWFFDLQGGDILSIPHEMPWPFQLHQSCAHETAVIFRQQTSACLDFSGFGCENLLILGAKRPKTNIVKLFSLSRHVGCVFKHYVRSCCLQCETWQQHPFRARGALAGNPTGWAEIAEIKPTWPRLHGYVGSCNLGIKHFAVFQRSTLRWVVAMRLWVTCATVQWRGS